MDEINLEPEMKSIEATDDDRLAFFEALNKQLKPVLDDAKGDAKMRLMQDCEEGKSDRRPIMVNGEKVGDVGISYTTPKPVINPSKMEDAIAYLRELGLTEEVPVKGWEKHFGQMGSGVIHAESGEIVDWAYWQGRVPSTAAVRGCKPDDVMQALQRKFGASPFALLEA